MTKRGGVLSALLDVLYPPACLACARVLPYAAPFCEACDVGLERLPPRHCRTCAEPGEFPTGDCPRCRAAPPAFARAWAPLAHEGPVARAVHRFKYEDHPELAAPLAALLADEARAFLREAPALLVPLPLHVARYRERGYDQAHLLAHALGKETGRPVLRHALERARATKRQVGLSEQARALNVQDAFVARVVKEREVLLVDDVFTTGATAGAAARALVAAGARRVEVLTIARAFTPD